MRCIDEKATNIILKLIGHDGNILDVCEDTKEISNFIYELISLEEISLKYEFYIWDIIGPFAKDILTKKERDHTDYLYAQGTVRDRNKTQRGLKSEETAFVKVHQLYYNFIKPHKGLNGYTPAHFANIYLNLKDNKWENLLKNSIKYQKSF